HILPPSIFLPFYITLTLSSFHFFFHSYLPHRDLHSFPTRRSSDLLQQEAPAWSLPMHPMLQVVPAPPDPDGFQPSGLAGSFYGRSEEHTSELQSRGHLVCRLLLEKKKKQHRTDTH